MLSHGPTGEEGQSREHHCKGREAQSELPLSGSERPKLPQGSRACLVLRLSGTEEPLDATDELRTEFSSGCIWPRAEGKRGESSSWSYGDSLWLVCSGFGHG